MQCLTEPVAVAQTLRSLAICQSTATQVQKPFQTQPLSGKADKKWLVCGTHRQHPDSTCCRSVCCVSQALSPNLGQRLNAPIQTPFGVCRGHIWELSCKEATSIYHVLHAKLGKKAHSIHTIARFSQELAQTT